MKNVKIIFFIITFSTLPLYSQGYIFYEILRPFSKTLIDSSRTSFDLIVNLNYVADKSKVNQGTLLYKIIFQEKNNIHLLEKYSRYDIEIVFVDQEDFWNERISAWIKNFKYFVYENKLCWEITGEQQSYYTMFNEIHKMYSYFSINENEVMLLKYKK